MHPYHIGDAGKGIEEEIEVFEIAKEAEVDVYKRQELWIVQNHLID